MTPSTAPKRIRLAIGRSAYGHSRRLIKEGPQLNDVAMLFIQL